MHACAVETTRGCWPQAAGQAASLEAQAHEARALRAELSEARVAQGRAQAELQGALRRADQARKEL